MVLHQNEYVIVYWFSSDSLLQVEWTELTEKLKMDTFFKEITIIHELIDKKEPKYLIGVDIHFKFIIPPELQEGALRKTIARMNKIGLKKFAHVNSQEFIAQLALEQTFEENSEKKYEDKFFSSIEEANAWIFEK